MVTPRERAQAMYKEIADKAAEDLWTSRPLDVAEKHINAALLEERAAWQRTISDLNQRLNKLLLALEGDQRRIAELDAEMARLREQVEDVYEALAKFTTNLPLVTSESESAERDKASDNNR